MKRFFLWLVLGGWLMTSWAQRTNFITWQEFVDEIAEDEYAEEQHWTESMEELALLAQHPIDINMASVEQLMQLPFLSEEQINDIHNYIFLHGGMRSISELMSISSIDYRTRRYLSLFLYVDASSYMRHDTLSWKNLFAHARHDINTRMTIPLYYRVGYATPTTSGGYWGEPLYHQMRYRLSAGRHLSAGLTAKKDAGEPFHHNRGWDYYSGHVEMHDVGQLRQLVVGDYKLGFGEGLVINSGFIVGKSSFQNHVSRGIRPHRGTDETNFFRGAAATWAKETWQASAWVSHRRLDATLTTDGQVQTLQQTGLHRTTSELLRKHNVGSTLAGGHVGWRRSGFHVGMTGYFQRFHRKLSAGKALYQRYRPEGQNFGVLGAHYGYQHPWFSVSGETAYSTEKGGLATLHKASWKISTNYTLTALHRFYGMRYYSFYAGAMAENSNVQNESGGMLRLDATPVYGLLLMAYADFFYNPWPRYRMTRSSSGQDFLLQASYQVAKHSQLSVRYKSKRKELADQMQWHNQLRLQYAYQPMEGCDVQTMFNLHTMHDASPGWAVSERIRWTHGALKLSAMVSYFHAPEYQTRVFVYEPQLPGMFLFPSLYGKGTRLTAFGGYQLWKNRLHAEVLYTLLRYIDRRVQGSGMQEIRSPWKNDIAVQLRLRI